MKLWNAILLIALIAFALIGRLIWKAGPMTREVVTSPVAERFRDRDSYRRVRYCDGRYGPQRTTCFEFDALGQYEHFDPSQSSSEVIECDTSGSGPTTCTRYRFTTASLEEVMRLNDAEDDRLRNGYDISGYCQWLATDSQMAKALVVHSEAVIKGYSNQTPSWWRYVAAESH